MSDSERMETLNLHIYLGKKQGFDVSELVEMRKQRYLKNWGIYK